MRSVTGLVVLFAVSACGDVLSPSADNPGGAGAGASDPTCADQVQNGGESDVDCGGDACAPCALGRACVTAADCRSGNCTGGHCAAGSAGCAAVDVDNPSCHDCTLNGGESDIDCGGDACGPCASGLVCRGDADCQSSSCQGGHCATGKRSCETVDPANPSCGDCVKNGGETDVDCGGDACAPCSYGLHCVSGGDCLSLVCASKSCQIGGHGAACRTGADCTTAQCRPGRCSTGLCCS